MALIDTLRHELRLACLHLWNGRGGAAAAVVTLMLGIAASTAMFALVDGVLLRPLPVRDQAGLMIVWREPRARGTHVPFKAPEVDALSRGTRTLAARPGVGWHGAAPITVVERGSATDLRMIHVTGTFFEVLGTAPASDARCDPRTTSPVRRARSWSVTASGSAATVAPRTHRPGPLHQPAAVRDRRRHAAGARLSAGTEAWTTVAAMASAAANKTFEGAVANELDVIARVRAATSPAQADQELRALLPIIGQVERRRTRRAAARVRRFDDAVLGDVRPTVLALFAAVVLVLLLAVRQRGHAAPDARRGARARARGARGARCQPRPPRRSDAG